MYIELENYIRYKSVTYVTCVLMYINKSAGKLIPIYNTTRPLIGKISP